MPERPVEMGECRMRPAIEVAGEPAQGFASVGGADRRVRWRRCGFRLVVGFFVVETPAQFFEIADVGVGQGVEQALQQIGSWDHCSGRLK